MNFETEKEKMENEQKGEKWNGKGRGESIEKYRTFYGCKDFLLFGIILPYFGKIIPLKIIF